MPDLRSASTASSSTCTTCRTSDSIFWKYPPPMTKTPFPSHGHAPILCLGQPPADEASSNNRQRPHVTRASARTLLGASLPCHLPSDQLLAQVAAALTFRPLDRSNRKRCALLATGPAAPGAAKARTIGGPGSISLGLRPRFEASAENWAGPTRHCVSFGSVH